MVEMDYLSLQHIMNQDLTTTQLLENVKVYLSKKKDKIGHIILIELIMIMVVEGQLTMIWVII